MDSTRTRPKGAGHHRQKSSDMVNLEATIQEEPSTATLRPNKAPSSASQLRKPSKQTFREPKIVPWNEDPENTSAVSSWIHFQREAEAVCRRTKSFFRDSEESKVAIAEWKAPTNNCDIAAFLAKSTAAYKPLEQLPLGRIAHRRKSSLSDSRHLTSPYGLPLPKPIQANRPKGSLTTKFERSNSATSSTFALALEDPNIQPSPPRNSGTSSIFARFAREHPPSPPPTIATFAPISPFQLPSFDAFGLKKEEEEKPKAPLMEQRARVNSAARRQKLGWGRRRNSDGPAKVVNKNSKAAMMAAKIATGATFASVYPDVGRENKENKTPGLPYVYNSCIRRRANITSRQGIKTKRSGRAMKAKRVASQARGLRV